MRAWFGHCAVYLGWRQGICLDFDWNGENWSVGGCECGQGGGTSKASGGPTPPALSPVGDVATPFPSFFIPKAWTIVSATCREGEIVKDRSPAPATGKRRSAANLWHDLRNVAGEVMEEKLSHLPPGSTCPECGKPSIIASPAPEKS